MKLSIITVNKNNAKGLEKTCISVANQTNKDFEWIIIDGASTDNSIEIIKKYEQYVSFWISEPDTGIYNAMNKGIRKANGEYCLFLNSGDWLVCQWTLNDVFNEINKISPADVYYSDVLRSNYYIERYPSKIYLSFFIYNEASLNHQNCLIKRKLFDYCLYREDLKIASDWYFLIFLFIKYKISFVKINTFISFFDFSGISVINFNLFFLEKKRLLNELNIKRNKYNELIKILKKIKYILPLGLYLLIKKLLKKIIKD